jgi:tetratricopeptide (TPR) repeat protein
MIKFLKIFILATFIVNFSNISLSKENFYTEGVKLFKTKKYEEAKFLFERSIVLDPKHSESYLYLAKIYKEEEDKKKEEKNLETTLLIDPANEEAILMLMEIALEKTNYSKVKELSDRFIKICKNLCKENEQILKDLENLEPKNNES